MCEHCNVLGDEFHTILVCEMYTALRKKYISPYYWRHPSMQKVILLLTSDNKKTIHKVATFLYKVMLMM